MGNIHLLIVLPHSAGIPLSWRDTLCDGVKSCGPSVFVCRVVPRAGGGCRVVGAGAGHGAAAHLLHIQVTHLTNYSINTMVVAPINTLSGTY